MPFVATARLPRSGTGVPDEMVAWEAHAVRTGTMSNQRLDLVMVDLGEGGTLDSGTREICPPATIGVTGVQCRGELRNTDWSMSEFPVADLVDDV